MGYAYNYYGRDAEPETVNTSCFPKRNLTDVETDASIDEISKSSLAATIRLRGGVYNNYSTVKPKGSNDVL